MGCRRSRHRCRRLLSAALLLALALGGCSLNQALRPESYTVHRGDTLWSIAHRYGIDDWHDLARWNQIGSPYRLAVGQRLTLDPYPPLDYSHMPGEQDARGRRIVRAPQDSPAQQQRSIRASTPQLKRTIETADRGAPAKPDKAGAAKTAASAPRPPSAQAADQAVAQKTGERRAKAPAHVGGPSEDGWQWPASGSIVRGYGPKKGRRGIEIGGQVGAPVYAASSGEVVYNGSGLKGYGKLIIIKHDKHYLSAYGFNARTLVKQGQNVAAGAHIADMGLGPENKPMLHFEIRRDGDPIDPESVLPEH